MTHLLETSAIGFP